MSDMVGIILHTPPGTPLAMEILRNSERRNVHVTLGNRPAFGPAPDASGKPPKDRPGGNPPAKLPDPFRLDKSHLPHDATEGRASVELLHQRLDRLEQRMAKIEQSMVDLLKLLNSR